MTMTQDSDPRQMQKQMLTSATFFTLKPTYVVYMNQDYCLYSHSTMGWGKRFFYVEYPLSPAQYCATKLLVLAVATHPTAHKPESLN